MKTKNLITVLTICVLLFNMVTCKSQPQNSSDEEVIIKTIRTFYTGYITENVKMPINGSKILALKKQYCTAMLLDSINNQEIDYDPFLNAQDANLEWLQSLTVQNDTSKNGLYIVSYTDNGKWIVVKLKIIKQNDSFKINSIL